MLGITKLPPELLAVIRRSIPRERWADAKQLMTNQLAVFQRHDEDPSQVWFHTAGDKFGEDWIQRFMAAQLRLMCDPLLHEIMEFGVSDGPIIEVPIKHYIRGDGTEHSPTFALRFYDHEMRMQTRRCTRPSNNLENEDLKKPGLWVEVMERVVLDLVHEFLNDLLSAAPSTASTADTLLADIDAKSEEIRHLSVAGPANRLLVGPKLAALIPFIPVDNYAPVASPHRAGEFNGMTVYLDPEFPEDDVLIWHYEPKAGHSAFRARIYYFDFWERFQGMTMRYGKFLSSTDYCRALKVS